MLEQHVNNHSTALGNSNQMEKRNELQDPSLRPPYLSACFASPRLQNPQASQHPHISGSRLVNTTQTQPTRLNRSTSAVRIILHSPFRHSDESPTTKGKSPMQPRETTPDLLN